MEGRPSENCPYLGSSPTSLCFPHALLFDENESEHLEHFGFLPPPVLVKTVAGAAYVNADSLLIRGGVCTPGN